MRRADIDALADWLPHTEPLFRQYDVPAMAAAQADELWRLLAAGPGLGRRILTAFLAVLQDDGFRRIGLEVAAYNARAIAAYRAAGFVVHDERWAEPEPGLALAALLEEPAGGASRPNVRCEPDGSFRIRVLRMICRLAGHSKDTSPL